MTDMAASMGLVHYHQDAQVIGGGVAIFDYDNDGHQDIYLTGGSLSDRLLRNLSDWQFELVSPSAGIPSVTNAMGVVTGDIDNDGDADIFLATRGGQPCLLLLNNGNGTFTDVSGERGITQPSWSTAAAMADINLDGHLDIYVMNYVESYNGVTLDENGILTELDVTCLPNFLYLNTGNGSFIEVAEEWGCADVGCGLATTLSDFDGDGAPDIIVANDFGQWAPSTILYRNRFPESGFLNVSASTSFDYPIDGMGVAPGDPDRDGDIDYYLTHLGPNVLAMNDGNGGFVNQAEEYGIDDPLSGELPSTGWGCVFADFDHDGWEDLFVVNGHITTGTMYPNALTNVDRLFINNADGTFTDMAEQYGCDSPDWGRGVAFGDLDNDGDLDLIVVVADVNGSNAQFSKLYRNDIAEGNWLMLELTGVVSNRNAYGSTIQVHADGTVMVRELRGGESCSSQNASQVHFGLGSAAVIDSVIVRFPSGVVHRLYGIEVNQKLTVIEDFLTGVEAVNSCEPSIRDGQNGQLTIITCPGDEMMSIWVRDMAGRSLWHEIVPGNESVHLPSDLSGPLVLTIDSGRTRFSRLIVANPR